MIADYFHFCTRLWRGKRGMDSYLKRSNLYRFTLSVRPFDSNMTVCSLSAYRYAEHKQINKFPFSTDFLAARSQNGTCARTIFHHCDKFRTKRNIFHIFRNNILKKGTSLSQNGNWFFRNNIFVVSKHCIITICNR